MPPTSQTDSHGRDEAGFLADYDANAFDGPSLAVDIAIFAVSYDSLIVALVQRTEHPHLGRWALPGGFVRADEGLDRAATRVLETKARLTGVFVEQLYTFGAPTRDPRTRVVSVAYYALVDAARFDRAAREGFASAVVAVPWSGEVRIKGSPRVVLTARSKAISFTGINP